MRISKDISKIFEHTLIHTNNITTLSTFLCSGKGTIQYNQMTDTKTGEGSFVKGYMTVDDILYHVGANGPFQWLVLAILLFVHIPGKIYFAPLG